jgi:hypothetical protein
MVGFMNKILCFILLFFDFSFCAANPPITGPLQAQNNFSEIVDNGTQSIALGNLGGSPTANPTFTGVITNNTPGTAITIGGSTAAIGSAASFFYPTYFSNPATGVVSKFNRIQVGIEALSSENYPQTTKSWLETLIPNTGSVASVAATNQQGQLGIVGASRTSDFRTWAGSASGGSQGVSGFGINDDTGSGTPIACGVCAEVAQYSGVNGITINQDDAANENTTVDVFPSSGIISGTISSLLLTGGAIPFATTNISAGLIIGQGKPSGPVMRKGIEIFSDALDTTVGAGGGGVAIEMGSGESERWLNPSNSTVAEIFGNSTGLNIEDNTTVFGANSGNAFTVQATGNTGVGAAINLIGNGSTTPAKTIRVLNGVLQFENNASSSTIAQITDGGDFSATAEDNTPIGQTVPSSGEFTTLNASGNDSLTYGNTSGQSIPNNSSTTITGWTEVFDRLGVNFNASTGVFTAPTTGYYNISSGISFTQSTPSTTNEVFSLNVIANSQNLCNGADYIQATSDVSHTASASCNVFLTASQTAFVQAYQNSGSSVTLSTGSGSNYISINRIP